MNVDDGNTRIVNHDDGGIQSGKWAHLLNVKAEEHNGQEKIGHSGNIIDLDHDSIDCILSYCPNRGSFEIQSLTMTCRLFNNLFCGRNGREESISGSVKETIRSNNLLQRIKQMYLPRLYFQVFVPVPNSSDADMGPIVEEFMECFSTIFGAASRILSDREMEVDFDFSNESETNLLDILDRVVSKRKIVGEYPKTPKRKHRKLYKMYDSNDKKYGETLRNHLSLREMYSEWKDKPLFEKKQRLNPFRLCNRTILQFQFLDNSWSNKEEFVSRDSSIQCSDIGRYFVFLSHTPQDEISFNYGTIYDNFNELYGFESEGITIFEKSRIILYYIFRHKIIPRMNSTQIDLKHLFGKDQIDYIQKLDHLDQYYYLTLRENVIKKYRDSLTMGKIQFPSYSEGRFNFKINGRIIIEFLTLASLETMNNTQRIKFIEQFFKHIYNSGLELSHHTRELLWRVCKLEENPQTIRTRQNSDGLILNFERIFFKREKGIVSTHNFQFPNFPSLEVLKQSEKTEAKLSILTASGQIDKCYSGLCCTSRFCGLCNACMLVSCWCTSCCCCYRGKKESSVYLESRGMGCPSWLSHIFGCICRIEHRFLPMLDCSNWADQCCSVMKGSSQLKSNYSHLY